jgi:hypothetical protein
VKKDNLVKKETKTLFSEITSDGRVEYNIADNPIISQFCEREDNKMNETGTPLNLGLIETELAIVIVLLALILLQGEDEDDQGRGKDKESKKEEKGKGKGENKDHKDNKNNSIW